MILDMNMASFYAAAKAVRASMPKDQQRSDADLEKAAKDFRDQSSKVFKEQTLAGMLFVYRNASTDEIRNYHALMTSPQGQWLLQKLRAAHTLAMNRSMEEVGRDFGEQLGKRMSPTKPSPAPSPAR